MRHAEGRLDPLASLDHAITADRAESKYLLDGDRLRPFLRTLLQHLAFHRYTGEGANALPDADHYTTTIYFDTPSHALLRAARANQQENIKLRAREYYDLHSSLAELATDPEEIVRFQPWLWFELKRRDGERTFKHRVRLEKARVPAFFRDGFAAPAAAGPEHEAIRSFCAGLGEPLQASCLVNYRRLSFQDVDAELRVTVDLELSFYAPPVDLWQRERALVRGTFGRPCAVESFCLIEVKRRAALPDWLEAALATARATPVRISKFLLAGEAVHGSR